MSTVGDGVANVRVSVQKKLKFIYCRDVYRFTIRKRGSESNYRIIRGSAAERSEDQTTEIARHIRAISVVPRTVGTRVVHSVSLK